MSGAGSAPHGSLPLPGQRGRAGLAVLVLTGGGVVSCPEDVSKGELVWVLDGCPSPLAAGGSADLTFCWGSKIELGLVV